MLRYDQIRRLVGIRHAICGADMSVFVSGKNMDSSDLEDDLPVFTSGPNGSAETLSLVTNGAAMQTGADVVMVSSGSDDEAPYVPLAQRLKQRRDDVSSRPLTADRTEPQPLSSPPIGHQVPGDQEGVANLSLPKRKHPVLSVEEIQDSEEGGLKRSKVRVRAHQDNEGLRHKEGREKSERKALAEAAKALRPEECIKHMVVVVDPGQHV